MFDSIIPHQRHSSCQKRLRSCAYAAAPLPDAGFTAAALRWLAALVLGALLTACGTLPAGISRTPSSALPPNVAASLGKIAQASIPSPEQSGVRLLPIGVYSLDTRLELAQRAQHSLDLQYYQIENDPTGRLLLRQLRDASLRGVRVRLLVDDLYTTHIDALLRGLSAYPNVEVRLFNPFCCARDGGVPARYAASILDFSRLNHRMHNKLFIADGVMAVAGGRNIADEYFLRAADSHFVDIDAFVMGRVVDDMATIFDRYWNSDVVVPIEAIQASGVQAEDGAAAQAAFSAAIDQLAQAPPLELPPVDVLGYGPLSEDFDAGRVGLAGAARVRLPTRPTSCARRPRPRHLRAASRTTW
jgi:putative cardiolipin synthase